MNTFGYVAGNPLRYSDQFGLLDPNKPLKFKPKLSPIKPTSGIGVGIRAALGPIGVGIGALLHSSPVGEGSEVTNQCESDDCPPCITVTGRLVPKGTLGYRPLDVIPDDEMQHGRYGSHHNMFRANQNPNNCQCFWQKLKYVLKPHELPVGAVPVELFVN
jgi:hypothetical protein